MRSRTATLAEVAEQLGSDQEARWILEEAGDRWPELVARRVAGEPLQYVLGRWPFRHLELLVDRRVLIPRPETEQVVEVALAELRRRGRSREGPVGTTAPVAVDLGTGSGAIALALASEGGADCPGLEVWATDISLAALAAARENLQFAGGEARDRVHLAEGDWFDALPPGLVGRVDLLVSNPPYVPEDELADLDPAVRDWEPRQALAAAPDSRGTPGMGAVEHIVAGASDWLGPEGVLVVELDPSQAGPAADRAGAAGFHRVRIERDLAGRDRMLVAAR